MANFNTRKTRGAYKDMLAAAQVVQSHYTALNQVLGTQGPPGRMVFDTPLGKKFATTPSKYFISDQPYMIWTGFYNIIGNYKAPLILMNDKRLRDKNPDDPSLNENHPLNKDSFVQDVITSCYDQAMPLRNIYKQEKELILRSNEMIEVAKNEQAQAKVAAEVDQQTVLQDFIDTMAAYQQALPVFTEKYVALGGLFKSMLDQP